jgi:hypothetical protein
MHDGNAASQPVGVYDLNCEVEKAVPIKVSKLINRVQPEGKRESLFKTCGAQGAVRPEGDARESARGELCTCGRHPKHDESG